MDIILDQSSEDLLCCRVCLMTDCKLFNIHEYKLADTLSRISGTPIFRLPQYLCTYCHTLLLKCARFRTMCLRTDQGLKKEVLQGELNTDRIRRIDRGTNRLFHLTLTEAEIVDIPPSEKINEPNVDMGLPKIERVYKAEPSTISIDDDSDDYETNSNDLEANMHTYNVKAVNVDHEASITTDEGEDIDEPNSVEIDESNTHTVNTDAPNIQKVGVVKRFIDKDMQETCFNTVNVAPIRKPELKMELEMMKGQLNIKVVKDARNVNTITALKRISPEMEASKIKVLKVSSVANKMKTVKTYSAYSDKVNDELDKTESNIDQDTAMDKANKNVSYKSINTAYASIINDDIGDSDIDDINELNAHMYVVDVDSILKKSVKKCKRNIGITVKKNIEESIYNSDNEWNERKIKYRNPENDYLPEFDFAKFESDYGVKIVTLSKQEQLEEIAARKQSANYTTAQFPCEDCGKGFDLKPTYNNHRRRHSPSAGSHACEICLVRFKLPSLRHQHQDLHRLKFVCECGFVSRTRSAAKMHHEMHNGRRFFCKHCGKGFSKRTSCLSHVRLTHPTLNVVCGACGETFVSEHGLKMHASKIHPEIMKPQQFKCPTCSASFVSSDALNRHTDSGEHAGCPCEQCGESCASEEALQAHVGERHPSDSHRCEECRATFSSGAAFDTHFRRKHLNERYTPVGHAARKRPARPGPRRVPPRGQFVCEQCGHILPSAALLRYHQNGHLAVKPFPCAQCPKTFASNAARNWHTRVHKGERPYKCPVCSLTFMDKANMKRHHNVVHLGVHANASCHACARVFTCKSTLKLHISSVHNGQPWPRRERRRKVAKD